MNTDSAKTVLVLDGESRAALAVVRSLGKQSIKVIVASVEKKGLAGHSRFASKHLACPSVDKAPDTFRSWLTQIIKEENISHLLPITDTSLRLSLSLEDEIRKLCTLPTVNKDVFDLVSNKDKLLDIASDLGVRCPKSITLVKGQDLVDEQLRLIESFDYPAVAKPVQSSEHQGAELVQAEICYFDSASEALKFFSAKNTEAGIRYLLQERIWGSGVGVFALCSAGEAVQLFAHRRILEKPPSGGRSVLCESLPLDKAPVEQAKTLLKHFKWNGVAMVEFKQDRKGEFYLMEINPRFWGSLQLAIDSGRNFPASLLDVFPSGETADAQAIANLLNSQTEFTHGLRLRWSLGCLDHFLIRLKREGVSAIKDTLLCNALQFFARSTIDSKLRVQSRLEVLRREDPRPFFVELRNYILSLLRIA
jgi:predicted ATP-grasp superfamily ATP-dependent carboligase